MTLPSAAPHHMALVGPRPAGARPWIKRMGALLLLSAATLGTGVQAHDHHGTSRGSENAMEMDRYLPAPMTQSARLASNVLLDRASARTVDWLTPGGAMDGPALLRHWERQGLRPDQGMELLSLLVFTQSPTLARTQAALSLAEKSSRATQSILDIETEAQADTLLDRRSPEDLVKQEAVMPSIGWNRADRDTSSWSDVHAYWDQLSIQTGGSPEKAEASSPAQVQAALKDLASATDEAGLAALQIPLPAMGRADVLTTMASKLREANQTLSTMTGMSGPVMGLNGRIAFMPFSPIGNAYAYRVASAVYRVEGLWEDFPHEWIHNLDFLLRSVAPSNDFGGASLSHQVWTDAQFNKPQEDLVVCAWSNLYEQIDPNQPKGEFSLQWNAQRADAIKTHALPDQVTVYIAAPAEIVGYAFGSFVQSRQSKGQVFHDPRQDQRLAYSLGPSVEAASTLAPHWERAFTAINTSWWSGQVANTPSTPRNLAQAAAQWNTTASVSPLQASAPRR